MPPSQHLTCCISKSLSKTHHPEHSHPVLKTILSIAVAETLIALSGAAFSEEPPQLLYFNYGKQNSLSDFTESQLYNQDNVAGLKLTGDLTGGAETIIAYKGFTESNAPSSWSTYLNLSGISFSTYAIGVIDSASPESISKLNLHNDTQDYHFELAPDSFTLTGVYVTSDSQKTIQNFSLWLLQKYTPPEPNKGDEATIEPITVEGRNINFAGVYLANGTLNLTKNTDTYKQILVSVSNNGGNSNVWGVYAGSGTILSIVRDGVSGKSIEIKAGLQGSGTAVGLYAGKNSTINLQGHIDLSAENSPTGGESYEIFSEGAEINISTQGHPTVIHAAYAKTDGGSFNETAGNVELNGGSLTITSSANYDASFVIGSSKRTADNIPATGLFTATDTNIVLNSSYRNNFTDPGEQNKSFLNGTSHITVGEAGDDWESKPEVQRPDSDYDIDATGTFITTGGSIIINGFNGTALQGAAPEGYEAATAEIIVGRHTGNEKNQNSTSGTTEGTVTLTGTSLTLNGGAGGNSENITGGNAHFHIGYLTGGGTTDQGNPEVIGNFTATGNQISLNGGAGGTAAGTKGGDASIRIATSEVEAGKTEALAQGEVVLGDINSQTILNITGGDSNQGDGGAAELLIGSSDNQEVIVSGSLTATNSQIFLTGGDYTDQEGSDVTAGGAGLIVGKNTQGGTVSGQFTATQTTIVIKGGNSEVENHQGGLAHLHVGSSSSTEGDNNPNAEGQFTATDSTISLIGGNGSAAQGATSGSAQLHVGNGSAKGTKFTAQGSYIFLNSGPQYNNEVGSASMEVFGNAKLFDSSRLVINYEAANQANSYVQIYDSLTLGQNGQTDGSYVLIGSGGILTLGHSGGNGTNSPSCAFGGTMLDLRLGGTFFLYPDYTLSIEDNATFTLQEGAVIYNFGEINVRQGGKFEIVPVEGQVHGGGVGTVNVSGLFEAADVELRLHVYYANQGSVEAQQNEFAIGTVTIQNGGRIEVGELGFERKPKPDYYTKEAGFPSLNVQAGGRAAIGTTLASLEGVVLPSIGNIPNTFGGNADTIVQVAQPNGINVSQGAITINSDNPLPNTAGGQVTIGSSASTTLLVVPAIDIENPAAPFNLGTTATVAESTAPETNFTIAGGTQTSVIVLGIENIVKDGTLIGHVSNGFDNDEVSPGTYIVSENPLWGLKWIPAEDGHLTSAYTIFVDEEVKQQESLEAAPSQPPIVGVLAMNMVIDSIWDHGSKLAGYGHDEGDGDLWIDLNWNHSKADYTTSGYGTGYRGDLYGATFGGDYQFTEKFAAGLSFSVGTGNTRGKGITSGVKTDTTYWGLTLYAVADTDYANFIGNVSWLKARNKLKGLSEGKPKIYSDVLSAGLRVEKPLHVHEKLDIVPHIGVSYLHVKTDSFNYGQFHYDKSRGHFAELPIGVAAMGNFKTDSEWLIKPLLDLQISPTLGRNKVNNKYRIVYYDGPGSAGSFDSAVTSRVMYEGKIGINAIKGKHAFGLQFALGLGNNDSRVDTTLMAKYRYSFR